MRSVGRRAGLAALIAATVTAAVPAAVEAARYTGTTTQRQSMTMATDADQVLSFRVNWGVSCFAQGRTFRNLFVDYDHDRPGAVRVPLRNGRFRISGMPRNVAVDAAGTRGTIRAQLAGHVNPGFAIGYALLELRVLGPDGRVVVDTCHTGRINWGLRPAGG